MICTETNENNMSPKGKFEMWVLFMQAIEGLVMSDAPTVRER